MLLSEPLAASILLLAMLPAISFPAAPDTPKQVLLLLPLDSARPAAIEILRGMERGLARSYRARVTIHVEFAGLSPTDSGDFGRHFSDWLAYKYQGRKLDAICPLGSDSLALAERLRDRLWPGTPIVFGISKGEYSQLSKPRPGATGVVQDRSEEETIRAALQMLPETTAIALVGGSATNERQANQRIAASIRRSYPAIPVIDMAALTLDQVAARAGALPAGAILYLSGFSIDSNGTTITMPDLAAMLHAKANGPVFSNNLLVFGSGTVGGLMNGLERGTEYLGEHTARVLRGELPEKVPVSVAPPVAAVDWRELKKWHIPENRIPPGAEVRFRQLTLWEEHRLSILATAAALLLQAILIGFLLLERRRRRLSESIAAESADLNRAVLSSQSGRTAVLDQSGTVIGLSPNWTLDGAGISHVLPVGIGGNYLEWLRAAIGGGDRSVVTETVTAVLQAHRESGLCEYHLSSGDRSIWCEVRVEKLNRKGGGAVVTHLDITGKKQSELNRRRTLDELHHMNRVASVGQLAGALAHELAQPLASILSNAQAAERFAARTPPDYGEIREALAEITADDRRARTIIDRMRSILTKQPVPVQEVDLNQVAREVSRLVQSAALMRSIALTLDLHPASLPVRADHVPLQRVLLNLLNNGMDALEQSSNPVRSLLVKTTAIDGCGVMIVSDNGPGIPEADQRYIFDSFYTTKGHGLGLGLSICRSIVESFAGHISCENSHDGGATFRVALPVALNAQSLSAGLA